jgi:TonB family protein
MNQRQLLILFILLFLSETLSSQTVSDKQLLKLELHSTDNTKFIAKLYNYKTGKLEEYWEMITHVPEISIADFNKQLLQREIEPHGKYYLFYENRAKKLEGNYLYGAEMGEIKGYYESGELRFKGISYRYEPDGEFTHYYKDGSVKKVENFENGSPNGKLVCYYPFGNIYMKTNFIFGNKDGKQTIYYPNGETKRETKYKMNTLISEKCFDSIGVKTQCHALITEPDFVEGKDQFLANLQKFTFNNNNTFQDSVLFSISLKINTSGNADIQNYFFIGLDSLGTDFKNWIQKPGIFIPPMFDDQPLECNIHLIFPVYRNKIVFSDKLDNWHISNRNRITQEDEETYYWNFSPENGNTHYIVTKDTSTFFIVEKMPEFPGGEQALRIFIATNIKYPVLAQEKGIQGMVFVSFVVDENGYPVDLKVARGVHPLLDEEALRVVSLLPKWTPAMQRGKPVRVSYTVPVNFVLGGKINNMKIGNVIIE